MSVEVKFWECFGQVLSPNVRGFLQSRENIDISNVSFQNRTYSPFMISLRSNST